MEDVMETCWLTSVTMCPFGYKCETCPKLEEHELTLRLAKEELAVSREAV